VSRPHVALLPRLRSSLPSRGSLSSAPHPHSSLLGLPLHWVPPSLLGLSLQWIPPFAMVARLPPWYPSVKVDGDVSGADPWRHGKVIPAKCVSRPVPAKCVSRRERALARRSRRGGPEEHSSSAAGAWTRASRRHGCRPLPTGQGPRGRNPLAIGPGPCGCEPVPTGQGRSVVLLRLLRWTEPALDEPNWCLTDRSGARGAGGRFPPTRSGISFSLEGFPWISFAGSHPLVHRQAHLLAHFLAHLFAPAPSRSPSCFSSRGAMGRERRSPPASSPRKAAGRALRKPPASSPGSSWTPTSASSPPTR